MPFELGVQLANFIYKNPAPILFSSQVRGWVFHLLKMAKIYFTISYQLHTGVAYYS